MLRKFCALGIISFMFIMVSCHSRHNSKNSAETGAALDSMVDQATSAVKSGADSVKQSINTAVDSTKEKINAAIKKH